MNKMTNGRIVAIVVPLLALLIIWAGGPRKFLMEDPGHYGFAVDSKGLVYVGDTDRIKIFRGNDWIGTMPLMPRGYVFTIVDESVLKIASSTVLLVNLDGIDYAKWEENIFESWADPRLTERTALANKKEYTSIDGEKYYLIESIWGYSIEQEVSNRTNRVILMRKMLS